MSKNGVLYLFLILALVTAASAKNIQDFPYGGEESCKAVSTDSESGDYMPWFCNKETECADCSVLEHGQYKGSYTKCDESSPTGFTGTFYNSCMGCNGFIQAKGMGYGQGKCEASCGASQSCDEYGIGIEGQCGEGGVCNEQCQCESVGAYKARDEDLDGVPNQYDKCPGTELFEKADPDGCVPRAPATPCFQRSNPMHPDIPCGKKRTCSWIWPSYRNFCCPIGEHYDWHANKCDMAKIFLKEKPKLNEIKTETSSTKKFSCSFNLRAGNDQLDKHGFSAALHLQTHTNGIISLDTRSLNINSVNINYECTISETYPDFTDFNCSAKFDTKHQINNKERLMCRVEIYNDIELETRTHQNYDTYTSDEIMYKTESKKGDKCTKGDECTGNMHCSRGHCCPESETWQDTGNCMATDDPIIEVRRITEAEPELLFTDEFSWINLEYEIILNRKINTDPVIKKEGIPDWIGKLHKDDVGKIARSISLDNIEFQVVDEEQNEIDSVMVFNVGKTQDDQKLRVSWALALNKGDLAFGKKYLINTISGTKVTKTLHDSQEFIPRISTINSENLNCFKLSGPDDAKITVYYIGSLYDSKEEFIADAKTSIEGIMSIEPFMSNKDKIRFVANHYAAGNEREIGMLLDKCPHHYTMVLFSKKNFRSIAELGKIALISIPYDKKTKGFFGRKVNLMATSIHEFGHVFGGLMDEYYDADLRRENIGEPNCAPDIATAKRWWGDLENLDPERPDIRVGYYSGGCYSGKPIRPTKYSIMSDPYRENLDVFRESRFGVVNERCILKLINEGGNCKIKDLAKYDKYVREKVYAIPN